MGYHKHWGHATFALEVLSEIFIIDLVRQISLSLHWVQDIGPLDLFLAAVGPGDGWKMLASLLETFKYKWILLDSYGFPKGFGTPLFGKNVAQKSWNMGRFDRFLCSSESCWASSMNLTIRWPDESSPLPRTGQPQAAGTEVIDELATRSFRLATTAWMTWHILAVYSGRTRCCYWGRAADNGQQLPETLWLITGKNNTNNQQALATVNKQQAWIINNQHNQQPPIISKNPPIEIIMLGFTAWVGQNHAFRHSAPEAEHRARPPWTFLAPVPPAAAARFVAYWALDGPRSCYRGRCSEGKSAAEESARCYLHL